MGIRIFFAINWMIILLVLSIFGIPLFFLMPAVCIVAEKLVLVDGTMAEAILLHETTAS